MSNQTSTAVKREQGQQERWQLPPEPEELTRARQALKVLLPRLEAARKQVSQLEGQRQGLTGKLADPNTAEQDLKRLRQDASGQAALVLSARDELTALEKNVADARARISPLQRAGREAELRTAAKQAEAVHAVIPTWYNRCAEAETAAGQLSVESEGLREKVGPTQSRHGFAVRGIQRALAIIRDRGTSPLKAWIEVFEPFSE